MRLPEGVAPAVTAVLEDCVNQLAVLGASRPGGAKGTANLEQVVGDEIAEIVEQQRELEVEYDLLLAKRQELQRQPGAAQELEANDEALKEVCMVFHTCAMVRALSCPLRSPLFACLTIVAAPFPYR